MEYKIKKIKNLKYFLEKVPNKDVEILSSDIDGTKLNKKQIGLILDVATYLFGKDTFTEKQIKPYINQATIWFILEKLKREGLIKIDNKGVPHRTRLGNQVNKYIEGQDGKWIKNKR